MKIKTDISAFKKGKGIVIGIAALFTMLIISNTSCTVGHDGLPGRAFLAFSWEVDKPDYINCGTPDIPQYFNYGNYYRAYPGWYTLYYEGLYHNGYAWGEYAWEMEYEIWVYAGETGGAGYNGTHGPDSYLEIVCSPSGPYDYHSTGKSAEKTLLRDDYKVISETDNEIVVEQKDKAYTLKITYRKVEPRDQKESLTESAD